MTEYAWARNRHKAHLFPVPVVGRNSLCMTAFSGDDPKPRKSRRPCAICLNLEAGVEVVDYREKAK